MACSKTVEASAEQYAVSCFWPGNPGQQVPTYFFHTDLLRFWYFTKHEAPGTSEQKILEILGHVSRVENRVYFSLKNSFKQWINSPCYQDPVVNQPLFNAASKEYEYLNYSIDKKLRKIEKTSCAACADSPLAVHVDGNFKLYRFADSSTR